jgi:hypothetical protein
MINANINHPFLRALMSCSDLEAEYKVASRIAFSSDIKDILFMDNLNDVNNGGYFTAQCPSCCLLSGTSQIW